MSNIRRGHWQTLQWIICYLKRSLIRVVVFYGARWSSREVPIEGFVDSKFVGCDGVLLTPSISFSVLDGLDD